ncbi:MAG TPA: secretin N-terminal domain-containing protein, partial [Phycisphaerae bacterium]|nr:secretin N-terminal domain-containing protein [Phycisphaerae bacterium]
MKIATGFTTALLAFALVAPAPADPVDMSGFEQKVFRLQNAEARDTARMLQGFLSEGRVAFEDRTNSVVVSAPPAEIELADRLIGELDVPATIQSNESSAIIRVGPGAPPNFMDLIQTLVSGRTHAALDGKTGMLVLRGPTADIDAVRKLVDALPDGAGEPAPQPLTLSFFFVQGLMGPEN